MSDPRELDEETLIELKERREGELELFQEPSISTVISLNNHTRRSRRKSRSVGRLRNSTNNRRARLRSPLPEGYHGFTPGEIQPRIDLNLTAEEEELDIAVSELHQEFVGLYIMSNTKQAIKDHWVTNRKTLDELIKDIDSKLDIFDSPGRLRTTSGTSRPSLTRT